MYVRTYQIEKEEFLYAQSRYTFSSILCISSTKMKKINSMSNNGTGINNKELSEDKTKHRKEKKSHHILQITTRISTCGGNFRKINNWRRWH